MATAARRRGPARNAAVSDAIKPTTEVVPVNCDDPVPKATGNKA